MITSKLKNQSNDELYLRISDVIRQSPLAIVSFDTTGRISSWNQAAEKMFGWAEQEVLNNYMPTVSNEKYAEALDLYRRLMQGEVVSGFQAQRLKKDGTNIDVSIWAFPLYDSKNEKISDIVAVLFDITEQKKLEQRLREAKEYAEATSKAKNMFLANISHEIRTPIAAILGIADLINSGEELSETDLKEKLQIIERNSRHLLSLIDNVLDLTKIEADILEIERTAFNPVHEVESAISTIKPLAAKKNIELRTIVNEPIPTIIHSDPTRFRQILINLLNNAVKFTDNGNITVSMAAKDQQPKTLYLTVSDTGVGIPAEFRAKIFETFYQADNSTKRRFGGAGLGLPLSRRIARAMGGDIELINSKIGEGSVFAFSIKLEDNDDSYDKTTAPNIIINKNNKPLKNVNILIVDDCDDLCVLHQTLLKSVGATVDFVLDGDSAIKNALTKKYDVILMDIQMPKLDGFEVTNYLRKIGYRKPIIALTAHALLEERQKCFDAGCDDYLTKPIRKDILINTIYQQIHSKKFLHPYYGQF